MSSKLDTTFSAPVQQLIYHPLPRIVGPMFPFERMFRYSDSGTRVNLTAAAQARDDLARFLQRPTSMDAGIKFARAYLPHCLALKHVLETQQVEMLTQNMVWAWSTPQDGGDLGFRTRDVGYEVFCVVLSLGYMYANKGVEEVGRVKTESEESELVRGATQALRTAAGIFHYLAGLVQDWQPTTNNVEYMGTAQGKKSPELNVFVARGLEELCLAGAEQLSVVLAVRSNKMKKESIASLLMSVVSHYDQALRELSKSDDVTEELRNQVRFFVLLHRAMAFEFAGIGSFDAGKCGLALGLLRMSKGFVDEMSAIMKKVPQFMQTLATKEVDRIAFFLNDFQQDNMMVFFERVPGPEEITPPVPRSLLQRIEFEMPERAFDAIF